MKAVSYIVGLVIGSIITISLVSDEYSVWVKACELIIGLVILTLLLRGDSRGR